MALCWSSSEFGAAITACAVKFSANGTVLIVDEASQAALCRTEECADYFREFKKQVQRNCTVALSGSARRNENVSRDPDFCDQFLTTITPNPPVSTVPVTSMPATPMPTPVPATPAPTTVPVTTEPTIETAIPLPTAPLVSFPTPPPTSSTTALIGASTGISSSAAAVIGACAVVAAVALIGLIVLCCRRSRARDHNSQQENPTPHEKDVGTEFSEFPSPRATLDAASASTSSSSVWTHSSITTNRIPLDKVHVGPCISQGGYGEVCIGTYKNTPVAIKRLPPMRRKDPESIASFLTEIQLTSTLDHACIVSFIGVAWDAPSDLCMVSEFMSGGDMRSYLCGRASNSQGFDDDKLHIAVCVAHALTYLHSLQPVVVHRDLKSRNILLTQKPELHAKLMDFGVSCDRRDTTMTAGVGTSLWMAPEVMLGERYNEKADVFSFGVVLSELDTHELPYAQAKDPNSDRRLSEMVVMQRVVSGWLKPSFSSKADPEIVALADECLQLDPNLRPSAAVVLYRLHKNRFSV